MKPRVAFVWLLASLLLVLNPAIVLGYHYHEHRWEYNKTVNGKSYAYVEYDYGNSILGLSEPGRSSWVNSISAARIKWNGAGARFRFTHDADVGLNLVGRADFSKVEGFPNDAQAYSQTIPLSVDWDDPQYLENARHWHNTLYGWSSSPGGTSNYDIQSYSLHEFGHWLALEHVTSEAAIMNWSYLPDAGNTNRQLYSDDRQGIRAIYGNE